MSINKWWEKAEVIGQIKCKTFDSVVSQFNDMHTVTYDYVKVIKIQDHRAYVTNQTYKERAAHAEPLVILDVFVLQNFLVPNVQKEGTHEWNDQYCSCGQDSVTCQHCGKRVCGDLSVWRDGIGNIGFCCWSAFGLGHQGTKLRRTK